MLLVILLYALLNFMIFPSGILAGAGSVVARVDQEEITNEDLLKMIMPQLRQLQTQEYQLKRQAIEKLLEDKLLDIEAARKGISKGELMQQLINSQIATPSQEEISAFYLAQKDRIGKPLAEVRAQVEFALKQARINEARQEYLRSLRKESDIVVFLRQPRVEVSYDRLRMRGNANAPVVIVEFSDFQCSYCKKVQATLKQILVRYEGRVSLAFRDFPLQTIHPQAMLAAEAACCAGEQNRFWDYHDLLFGSPREIDRSGFSELARILKLDEKLFESCLASGKFRSQVEKDIEEGTRLGISGTPTFFINGVFLTGAQLASSFEKIIDDELTATLSNHQLK